VRDSSHKMPRIKTSSSQFGSLYLCLFNSGGDGCVNGGGGGTFNTAAG
jgi:hypothetical protein